jgi:hypothetical protein
MSSQNNLWTAAGDVVIINGRSSLLYWCERFSVAPFTLFHLLKTVGNSATEIGEFLHKHNMADIAGKQSKKSLSNYTIL